MQLLNQPKKIALKKKTKRKEVVSNQKQLKQEMQLKKLILFIELSSQHQLISRKCLITMELPTQLQLRRKKSLSQLRK